MCGFHICPSVLPPPFPHHTKRILEECNISFIGFTLLLGNKSSQNMKGLFRKETTNRGPYSRNLMYTLHECIVEKYSAFKNSLYFMKLHQ